MTEAETEVINAALAYGDAQALQHEVSPIGNRPGATLAELADLFQAKAQVYHCASRLEHAVIALRKERGQ